MSKRTKIGDNRPLGIRAWILALGLASVFACPAAMADDDLFLLDSSQWKSFEHNADDAKRSKIAAPEYPDIAASAQPETGPPPPATAPSPEIAVAAPTRPIDLPVMPGVNKGFAVQINSTEDERPILSSALVTNGGATDIHPMDKNWVAPTAPKPGQQATDEDGESLPLNVRMTYLPNQASIPPSTATHETAQHLAHLAMEKGLSLSKKKPDNPAEQAACAAIDAYKKQQLDALQSDRQTLKALQDAISSLGLDKQLSFMTGKGSNTLDASDTRPTDSIDTAGATAIR